MATIDAGHASVASIHMARRSDRSAVPQRLGWQIRPFWMLVGLATLSWGVVIVAVGLLDRLVELA